MPSVAPESPAALRLQSLVGRGRALELEGLPFPTQQIQASYEAAVVAGDGEGADRLLRRSELLLETVARDWAWIRELLRRTDELRELARRVGIDVDHLDSRVGNARTQLKSAPLSAGSLQKAAASSSAALAVLNDLLPKYCVQEGRKLGARLKEAQRRGEDVTEATAKFRAFLGAVQVVHVTEAAEGLIQLRHAIARIPKAPTIAVIPAANEEEEILNEARNLARRLHRIRGQARDAQSAARLMTQVRAVLSDGRRYGTPEEEIEALWSEVDRLTQERRAAEPEPAAAEPVAVDDPVAELLEPPPVRPRASPRAR